MLMKMKVFLALVYIFAITGVISSPLLESKIMDIPCCGRYHFKTGVAIIREQEIGPIAVATVISSKFVVTTGFCISEHENKNDGSQLFLVVGQSKNIIVNMRTHPKYNPSISDDFDMGIMEVKDSIYHYRWTAYDLNAHIQYSDILTIYGYNCRFGGPCFMDVRVLGVCDDVRKDKPFYAVPLSSRKTTVFESIDAGSPVFKNDKLVGIFSKHFQNTIVCTWLGKVEIKEFIENTLKNGKLPSRAESFQSGHYIM